MAGGLGSILGMLGGGGSSGGAGGGLASMLGGGAGGAGGGGGGGLGSILGMLGGGGAGGGAASGGGAMQGRPNGPYGATGSVNGMGSYSGISTGLSDGQVIGDDVLREIALQGTGPTDNNLIRNIFGTLLGDPGTPAKVVKGPKGANGKATKIVQPGRPRRAGNLGGFIGGAIQAVLGGAMGFVQNKGIESVAAALTAAGQTGLSAQSVQPAIAAFLGSGGAYAVAGAADQGLRGFRKGGGMAASQTMAHEVSGNIAPIADRLTNGGVAQALGGINERPAGQALMGGSPMPIAGGGTGAGGDGNTARLLAALNAARGGGGADGGAGGLDLNALMGGGVDGDIDGGAAALPTPIDTAKAMKKLKKKGITPEMIAKTGLSIEEIAAQPDGGVSLVKKANLASTNPNELLNKLAKQGITAQMVANSGRSLESFASTVAA